VVRLGRVGHVIKCMGQMATGPATREKLREKMGWRAAWARWHLGLLAHGLEIRAERKWDEIREIGLGCKQREKRALKFWQQNGI
jgi:hypothetical protein